MRVRPYYIATIGCFFIGIAYSCNKSDSQRSRNISENINQEETDPKEPPESQENGEESSDAPGQTSQESPDKATPKEIPDESSVPSYMFKSEELKKIDQLVEIYKPVISDPIPSFSSARQLVQTIEAITNEAMELPVHTPGRKFKVSVVNKTSFNAFMTGDSRIGLHLPTAAETSEDELLAVICHEMAHSARNHAFKSVDAPDFKISSALTRKITTYINTQVQGDIYIHDEERYLDLRQEWREATKANSEALKRDEAEADLIGAKLCGHMGMDVKTYRKSLTDFLSPLDSRDMKSPTQLRNGERLRFRDAKELVSYLFPLGSHPSAKERNEQLSRLEDLLKVNREDARPSLYKEWKASIPKLQASLSSRGLSLADSNSNKPGLISLNSGEVLHVPSSLGCSHGPRDLYDTLLFKEKAK